MAVCYAAIANEGHVNVNLKRGSDNGLLSGVVTAQTFVVLAVGARISQKEDVETLIHSSTACKMLRLLT